MKYQNAKDVLPPNLLKEIQKHINGGMLYIPSKGNKYQWGELSGYKVKLNIRNNEIRANYKLGKTVSELATEYYLSIDSIKKIVYSRRKEPGLVFKQTLQSALSYVRNGIIEEWVISQLINTKNDYLNNKLKSQEYTYFGIVKLPLRLIKFDSQKAYSDLDNGNEAPIILEFVNGEFIANDESFRLKGLKSKNINAYQSIILINKDEDMKYFMNNYGKHLRFINE